MANENYEQQANPNLLVDDLTSLQSKHQVVETKKRKSDIQQQAKYVGFTFVTTTLIGLINTFIVKYQSFDPKMLLELELKFRTAQVLDIVMFLLVMWMALALYLTTKSINANLAKLAFIFRFGETIIGFVIILFTFIPIVVLKSSKPGLFNEEELNSLASIFFAISNLGWNIHLILMGFGATIFLYLLTFSSYIPKWLGYWGLFTYISMIACFGLQLLLPNFPSDLMLIMAPGAAFEFVFGVWLLVKGVNVQMSCETAFSLPIENPNYSGSRV